jgi:hypothetical protein
MTHPRSILPTWLNRLLSSKPTIQTRCSCGRFCSTHDTPDVVSKLVAELTAQGKYVPARFREAGE